MALAATSLPKTICAASSDSERDPYRGLKVGMASYTLHKFNLDQAIAMTKEAGVKYISLKDVHLPLKSTREQRLEARKKVEAAGLVLMGGGVIYMKNNEDEIRNAFEYAKDAGMPTIVCSPDPDALDKVEKMAIKYDLRIAIHNHGPTDKKYPSPLDVLRLVKDRDKHMGICMDVGHTVRIGEDPLPVINQCASRLYEFQARRLNLRYRAADAPGCEVLGFGAQREDLRLVQRENRMKANPEQLLHVAQVAYDLGRGPAGGSRTSREQVRAPGPERLVELIGGAGQSRQTPLERLPEVLLAGGHRDP